MLDFRSDSTQVEDITGIMSLAKTQRTPRKQDRTAVGLCDLGERIDFGCGRRPRWETCGLPRCARNDMICGYPAVLFAFSTQHSSAFISGCFCVARDPWLVARCGETPRGSVEEPLAKTPGSPRGDHHCPSSWRSSRLGEREEKTVGGVHPAADALLGGLGALCGRNRDS
jgi:hypothetical protein